MIIETEAIVLKQIKTMGQRRMLVLFTKKYGKVSCGSSITEGGKNKSALISRPFTYGRYELYKGRETYNLNSGQVIESFYGIGEDLDKYVAGSYILELTEKLLSDEAISPRLFDTLLSFLQSLEKREKKVDTLVLAYIVKALDILGVMPVLDSCSECGRKNELEFFSIESGGMVCENCAKTLDERLIYGVNFDIVNILTYFKKEAFSSFEKLALSDEIADALKKILKKYMEYHLDIGKLKSESFEIVDPSARNI